MSDKNKLIVQTLPNAAGEKVGYVEPLTGQVISSRRPTVVRSTGFVQLHIAENKLKLLASNLPAEANDDDFALTFKDADGDVELAVASYISTFEE